MSDHLYRPVVQALHLFTNWMINGGGAVNSNQATWTLLGMAMRMVQILGLHRDGQMFGFSPEELTERRRVFWEVSRQAHLHSLSLALRHRVSVTTQVTMKCSKETDFRYTPTTSIKPSLRGVPEVSCSNRFDYRAALIAGMARSSIDTQIPITAEGEDCCESSATPRTG
jgi:hypothetical protein